MNQQLDAALPSVCIVIPVCNEEPSMPLLAKRLAALMRRLALRYRVHFLFIDDGSDDKTRCLLPITVPAEATFEVHAHSRNRGVGAAFRTAFACAHADIVCTIDADCSYGPEHLEAMIDSVASGEAAIVVASPYHPEGGVAGVPRWRLLLSSQCSHLYRVVTPLKLYTYTSIFRAYHGSVVRRVEFPSDGFVAAVEILLSASSLGYRVAEAPLVLQKRFAGVSKMRVGRTIATHARLITNCLFAGHGGYPAFCLGIEPLALDSTNVQNSEGVLPS